MLIVRSEVPVGEEIFRQGDPNDDRHNYQMLWLKKNTADLIAFPAMERFLKVVNSNWCTDADMRQPQCQSKTRASYAIFNHSLTNKQQNVIEFVERSLKKVHKHMKTGLSPISIRVFKFIDILEYRS
jgi:hypothetical protein